MGFLDDVKTGAIFLDIKGAFDNVVPSTLFVMLDLLGIPTKITSFLRAIITTRRVTSYCGGRSLGVRLANRGLPQGSTLSPILYNIYSSFLAYCLPEGIRMLMFADDIVIYCCDSELNLILDLLNRALSKLNEALRGLNLCIAPQKTQFCVFSKRSFNHISNYLRNNNLNLILESEGAIPFRLPLRTKVKFLGVFLDVNLSWKSHVDYVKKKTLPRINILKAISGIRWGAHPKTLIMVYKGLIRPFFDWGCQIMNEINPKVAIILDRLQLTALRVSLGLLITTPTNVILHICGELPLHLRRGQLTHKYLVKVCSSRYHPLLIRMNQLTVHPVSRERMLMNSSLLRDLFNWNLNLQNSIHKMERMGSVNFDYMIRFFNPEVDTVIGEELRVFKTSKTIRRDHDYDACLLSPAPSENLFREKIAIFNSACIMFTDGSKLANGCTGFSVFCEDPVINIKVQINSLNSIFEAEAWAILRAASLIVSGKFRNVVIASDSLSVLSCLKAPDLKGKPPTYLHDQESIVETLSTWGVCKSNLDTKSRWYRGK